MPTLLGICDLPVPETVQGRDFSPQLLSEAEVDPEMSAFLSAPVSYGILRAQGLPEYRGVRTARYTYVRHIKAPWLLYDNEADPYQMQNLCNKPQFADLQVELEGKLQSWLEQIGDEFLPGDAYLQRDNLTHYRETKNEWGRVKTPWTMPQ